jgi:hypothetical protein
MKQDFFYFKLIFLKLFLTPVYQNNLKTLKNINLKII